MLTIQTWEWDPSSQLTLRKKLNERISQIVDSLKMLHIKEKEISVRSYFVLWKPSHHCMHRMMITVLHPAGNLLNSLMGSGEEDDAAEEAQEDSSPIELDWACPRTKRTNEHTHTKKEEDHAASLLHLHSEGGTRLRSVFSEACCSQKPLPSHPV